MTLVHGDAKIDNFLFKKVKEKLEETYTAMIIDWQGEVQTRFEDESIETLCKTFFPIPHFNSGIHYFTHLN